MSVIYQPNDMIYNNDSIATSLPFGDVTVGILVILSIFLLGLGISLIVWCASNVLDGAWETWTIPVFFLTGLFLFLGAHTTAFAPTSANHGWLDKRQNIWEQLNDQGFKQIDLQGRILYAERDGQDLTCYFADLGEGTNWKVMCEPSENK